MNRELAKTILVKSIILIAKKKFKSVYRLKNMLTRWLVKKKLEDIKVDSEDFITDILLMGGEQYKGYYNMDPNEIFNEIADIFLEYPITTESIKMNIKEVSEFIKNFDIEKFDSDVNK